MDYEQTFAAARKVGAGKATDAGAVALFCEASIQFVCGAAGEGGG